MSDSTQRAWRFYLDDMIGKALLDVILSAPAGSEGSLVHEAEILRCRVPFGRG
jgi:hypothetical protein